MGQLAIQETSGDRQFGAPGGSSCPETPAFHPGRDGEPGDSSLGTVELRPLTQHQRVCDDSQLSSGLILDSPNYGGYSHLGKAGKSPRLPKAPKPRWINRGP